MQLIVLTDRLVFFFFLLLVIGLLILDAVRLEIVEQLSDSAFVLAHDLLFAL